MVDFEAENKQFKKHIANLQEYARELEKEYANSVGAYVAFKIIKAIDHIKYTQQWELQMVEDTQKRYADDITLQELVRLRVENERLRWALKRISICEGGDVTVIWKEMRDIAIEAFQPKESE